MNQTIITKQILKYSIFAVAFTMDNQGAYINGSNVGVKLVKWKQNATCEDHFDLTQDSTPLGGVGSCSMCFSPNDEELLIANNNNLLLFNTQTKKVTKELKFDSDIQAVK